MKKENFKKVFRKLKTVYALESVWIYMLYNFITSNPHKKKNIELHNLLTKATYGFRVNADNSALCEGASWKADEAQAQDPSLTRPLQEPLKGSPTMCSHGDCISP